jgi:ethanolamine ammonia-lyase small subunit
MSRVPQTKHCATLAARTIAKIGKEVRDHRLGVHPPRDEQHRLELRATAKDRVAAGRYGGGGVGGSVSPELPLGGTRFLN